jgi:Zn-finger nucleic acid-binding protein
MKCPVDHGPLVMTERSGVEIDYSQKCRGVWLDRGELDKSLNAQPASPRLPRRRSSNPSSTRNATATPGRPNGRSVNRASVNCLTSDVGALPGS